MKILFAAIWGIAILGGWLTYRILAPAAPPPVHAAVHVRRAASAPVLSTAAILSSAWPNLRRYNPRKLRVLIATGDVIPARSVDYKMVEYNDFLYPWRPTAAYIRTGDITLINLESPLINGCPVTDAGMTFCGDPRAVQGLQYAGVDVACTANNHIGNYDESGILETWQHLRSVGIQPCGLGTTAYRTVRGLRFAFLAYNCIGQRFPYAEARTEIRDARRHADIVVVSVHWGKEYVAVPATEPGIADDNPQTVAHFIIDSGADLIVGNHPHHVQAIELYHGHLIVYAHGNFIFDQMFSDETRQGVVGTYWFYGRKLVAVHYQPVFIYDYSQPRWATPAQAAVIMNEMRQATWQLAHGG